MRIYLAFFMLLISLSLSAKCRKDISVKYTTQYSWSKYYQVEGFFESGYELNNATRTYNYDMYATYCVIFWEEGEVSIIKLSNMMICGTDVTCSCVENTYGDLQGIDQRGISWKICTSPYCY